MRAWATGGATINSGTGATYELLLCYGTVASGVPVTGGGPSGQAIHTITVQREATATDYQPFTLAGTAAGSVNAAYYFDIQGSASANTLNLENVNVFIEEIL
jgi:hypothetical protein